MNQKYADLILIHSPGCKTGSRAKTYEGLLQAKTAGLAKSIGVSNFDSAALAECLAVAPVCLLRMTRVKKFSSVTYVHTP